ncbi:DUF6328 family protein [Bosea sp. BK604]|uniref:DUF6328 family protein n=1 Tax=Bosea sp. BK604 TaxID=2512180 RepID=UPI0010433F95|nr:DUF6328 family protein [Bosea sp. BK604]TCR68229.1 hypothetical protein EV560_10256 [Bosea sp. BK604]
MSLVNKTKTALDESRMLMLGAQVLLGFQFQAPFQNAFSGLSSLEKTLELVVLAIILGVVGLLITPSSYHRIALAGEASRELLLLIDRIAIATLALFAVAMGIDLGLAGSRIAGAAVGTLAAAIGCAACAALWLGPCLARDRREEMPTSHEKTPMEAKIDYALTEARVVLPGAQALLGFQLAIVLTQTFAELPSSLKMIHGLGLALIAIATALLIAPAAYHRIAYGGRDDPAFHTLSSRLILLATAFLALGISADAYLVATQIAGDDAFPGAFAVVTAASLLGFWHAWPWLMRRRTAPVGTRGTD